MNPRRGSEIGDAAATVMRRCASLANISEEPGLIVRPCGSRAMNACAASGAQATTRR